MRSVLASLFLALVLCTGTTGCFILDELNKGEALQNQHSEHRGASSKQAAAAKGKQADSGGLGGLGAGAIGQLQEKLEEAMEREPDPDNTIIRCRQDGRVEFTRKFDCQAGGGQVVMR